MEKKIFRLETGGKNYLLSEGNGYSVGLENTLPSGNKKAVVFAGYSTFSTNVSELVVLIKLLVFNMLVEEEEWVFVEEITGRVDVTTFRNGNSTSPNFTKICEQTDPDAITEIDFMYKVFMTGEFQLGIGMNDFIISTICNKTGWSLTE